MNYLQAGVDIEAGDALVRAITPLATATARAGVIGALGGFGAVFDVKAAGFVDPLLVSGTDGVGTKLKVALETGNHATIGVDLVAMSVNDVVAHGAQPLFFLDYFATGKLDQAVAVAVVQGITEGCRQADCALVGGETSEMPGLYPLGVYDLAGFAVGAVERDQLLPTNVEAGDLLVGLPSSGAHSNGFSLIRQIVAESGHTWRDPFTEMESFGQRFLTPTRIYVRRVLELAQQGLLHAAAHITGGGLIGNLPRVMPPGLTVRIDQPWSVPAEFGWLKRAGKVPTEDMLRTFNCGIGMVLVMPASGVPHDGIVLGDVVPGDTPHIELPEDHWWL